ncbi:MAG: cytochrome b/b6 domain-containing protein [Bacteroidota bacterium]|nr:cytochrome b/b6 domain-containing protein [Bacteroidota bacterium]
MENKKVIHKHPLAIRWLHWINFPLLAVMIWSGLLIYYANRVYKIDIGTTTIIKFFPEWFYDALGMRRRLAEGMSLHFTFMWLFLINGIIYFLYLIFSKEYKLIFPHRKALKEAWQVLLHDLHIKKGLPPQKKYNAAQRIAYTGVIMMGFLMIITGLAIYKPTQLNWLCAACGGYEAAHIEHFIITILFALFFLIHIIQVIIAGWNNFRSMITGFETKRLKPKENERTNLEQEED